MVAVLIGGDSKNASLTAAHTAAIARTLKKIRENQSELSFVISNSSRTTDAAMQAFLAAFPVTDRDHFYDWRSAATEGNPYLASLSMADFVVVTGDSMSMIADALKAGKPTYVAAPDGSVEERHKAFILQQFQKGRLFPLQTKLTKYSYQPLDTTAQIAAIVRERSSKSSLERCRVRLESNAEQSELN